MSVDVFDTAIVRRVTDPHAAFFLLAQRTPHLFAPHISPQLFEELRVNAEHAARRAAPGSEPTLHEIHEHLAPVLGLTGGRASQLLQAEVDIERDLAVRNPGLREEIEAERRRGARPVFVSDTYLPSTVVAELLRSTGYPDPTVITSCEERCSKWSGELFDRVLERYGVDGANTVHIGDNPISDDEHARLRGIDVRFVSATAPTRYEGVLEAHRHRSVGITSAMAGASRLTRLEAPGVGVRDPIITDVAAGVAGPVLVSFVIWLLVRSEALCLDRLYFSARDGEILLGIARQLQSRLGLAPSTDLRYLYGSRRTWHGSALADKGLSLEPWMLDDSSDLMLEGFCARLGLSPGDVAKWRASSAKADGTVEENARLLSVQAEQVLEDPHFRRIALDRSAQMRQDTVEYLSQEQLLASGQVGIVDLGWRGYSMASLETLLESDASRADRTYLFFGLEQSNSRPAGLTQVECFHPWFNNMPMYHILLEVFTAGREGQTFGFSNDGDRWTPSLKQERNVEGMRWGLDTMRSAVTHFVDHLSDTIAMLDLDVRSAEWRFASVVVADALLDTLWQTPSHDEATVWGSFPLTSSPLDEDPEAIGRPRHSGDLVAELRGSARTSQGPRIYWPQASDAASARTVISSIRVASRARHVAGTARKSLKSLWTKRSEA